MSWLAWWNVLYLIPGVAGLMLVFLSAIGVGHGHDMDHDMDHDADGGHDHDHDQDHGHEQDQHSSGAKGHVGGGGHGLLSLLGFGRVPFMIFLTMLLLFFAFIGFGLNQLLAGRFPVAVFFPISLACAGLGTVVLTGALSRVVARLVPKEESYAASYDRLNGQMGKVILLTSTSEGYAQIRDKVGNLLELRCQELNGKPLRKDQAVLVAAFDSEKRVCLVVENEVDDGRPST
jgi:hypothetical protein